MLRHHLYRKALDVEEDVVMEKDAAKVKAVEMEEAAATRSKTCECPGPETLGFGRNLLKLI